MNIEDIKALDGVKIAKYLPSDATLKQVSEKLSFKMGCYLNEYLSKCGYIEFSFVEIFGVTENKGLSSDMVIKTILLYKNYPQTMSYVALEDKGDGDYILCDERDNIFEFIPTFKSDLIPLNCDLFSYLVGRYNEIK